jgi:uncharacterized protein (TIGR02145 family)
MIKSLGGDLKKLFIILSLLLSSLICQDFGDGSDGDLLVDSTTIINNTITIVSANCYYGFDYLLVEDVTGFNVGDEILIITSEDLTSNIHSEISTGNFDFFMIVNVYEGIIYLDSTLTKNYLSDNRIHQVIKVPNYSNLTITEEGEIIANAWNGNNGGIISFKVSGTLVNNGKINVDGMGYRGGESVNTLSIPGNNGEGINGGSGGSPQNNDCYCHGGGGGGLSEMLSSDVCVSPNGQIVGDEEMLLLFFGGGGGSGSRSSWSQSPNGEGGAGGGIIFISSQTIINNGIISANGIDGTAGIDHRMCSGGSGAGGSIFLDSEQFNNFGIINSFGGEYVEAGSYNGGWATGIDIADGGEGSDGRIRIDYSIGNIGNIEPEPYLLPVPGCTHPNATNYDETANVDDGSCEYETVQIGHQVWMTENLKATHYRNGDAIPTGLDNDAWSSTEEGAYAVYDDDPANADIYGNLYNWYVVDDERDVCPENYHVPSDDEFKQLEMELGMTQEEADAYGYRGTNEGSKLAGSSELWNSGVLIEDYEFSISGFNALPSGFINGTNGNFYEIGHRNGFWCSDGSDNEFWFRKNSSSYSEFDRSLENKSFGLSIRCLSDEIQAITFLVPENFTTIQGAIDYSMDGDTILVSAGTYYENINFNGKNIALIGEDRETTIIDGGGSGSVIISEYNQVMISGFTIRNGNADRGGGVFIQDGYLNLDNCIISDNSANKGGGIYFYEDETGPGQGIDGGLTISNSTFSDNQALGSHGGGLYSYRSPAGINIESSSFSNNSALDNGGAVYMHDQDTPHDHYLPSSITDSNFSDNSSASDGGYYSGGAFYIENINDIVISNSSISNNSSWSGGGLKSIHSAVELNNVVISNNSSGDAGAGIHSSYSDITINDSEITNNVSGSEGGAISAGASSASTHSLIINNTTIDGNSSGYQGGGIWVLYAGDIQINDSYITNNSVTPESEGGNVSSAGGGLCAKIGANPVITNSTISNNSADDGAGIALIENANCTLDNVIISSNTTTDNFGGGMYLDGSSASINNSILVDNHSVNGGAIFITGVSSVFLESSLINNNTALVGGGIYQNSGNINIQNCTISGNVNTGDDDYDGSGIHLTSWESTVLNSVFWNNLPRSIGVSNIGLITISYSNIEGGESEIGGNANPDNIGEVNWLDGNIDLDPQFNDNYTLQSISPCIDAGDPASELDPDGTRADMGAYPYEQYQNSINLHEGANLISFYAIPKDNSVSNVLSSLGDNTEGIIGEGVAASKVGDTWVGSLTEIESTSGYWLKLGSSADLNLTGFPLAGENELYSLQQGANLVSYPYESDNAISSAIPDLFEGYIEGVIGEGVAAVQTAPGNWVGSLNQFERNKGYWLKSSSNFTFAYDAPTEELARSIAMTMDKDYNQSTEQAFYFIEDIQNIELGDIVSAYCNDTKVGSREWDGSYTDIPAMGNDNGDLTKDYCTSNSTPTFRVEKANGETYQLTGDIPLWENNGLHMLSTLQEAIILPESYSLAAAYPNPFNPTTTINFAIPADTDVSISVYSLQGREVVSLASGSYDAGYHSVIWNADSHSSGVYFVKMVAGSYVNTQKLMLVK